jgi:hypothetical protein
VYGSESELLWGLMRNHGDRPVLAARMPERKQSRRHDDLVDMLQHRARGYGRSARCAPTEPADDQRLGPAVLSQNSRINGNNRPGFRYY